MMFGTEINMPIDVIFGAPPSKSFPLCPVQYVEWIKQSLKHTYSFANDHLNVSARRQKYYYDLKAKPTSYKVGSFVWRWYWPAARGKLGKGWVGPFRVIKCPTSIHCVIQKSPTHTQIRVHIVALKPYFGATPEAWENEPSTEVFTPVESAHEDANGCHDGQCFTSDESSSSAEDGRNSAARPRIQK